MGIYGFSYGPTSTNCSRTTRIPSAKKDLPNGNCEIAKVHVPIQFAPHFPNLDQLVGASTHPAVNIHSRFPSAGTDKRWKKLPKLLPRLGKKMTPKKTIVQRLCLWAGEGRGQRTENEKRWTFPLAMMTLGEGILGNPGISEQMCATLVLFGGWRKALLKLSRLLLYLVFTFGKWFRLKFKDIGLGLKRKEQVGSKCVRVRVCVD